MVSARFEWANLATQLRAEGHSPVQVAHALRGRFGLGALAALRYAHGWSQRDAADEWNRRWPENIKTYKDISSWETGRHTPSLDNLDRLAQLYACDLADLLADRPGYRQHDQAAGHREGNRPLKIFDDQGGQVRHGIDEASAATGRAWSGASSPLLSRVEVGADLGGSPADFVARTVVDAAAPGRVGASDVEIVCGVTRVLAGTENAFGGGAVTHAGLGQLQWAATLLGARAVSNVRRALFEAVGNLAEVVGFSALDVAAYQGAERLFRFALWCADEGACWSLRACVLADMARVYAEAGHVDSALSAIEFAQVRMDRLPATAQAMLRVMRARYLALAGRHDEALREATKADESFADHDPAADPPWLCYYDEAEHDGSVGRALIPVAAATGRPELSASRLEAAVRRQAPEYPRSRVFSSLRLATLLMSTGDPDHAAAIASRALRDATNLRSRRVTDEITRLLRASDHRAEVASVDQLRQKIEHHLTGPAATGSIGRGAGA